MVLNKEKISFVLIIINLNKEGMKNLLKSVFFCTILVLLNACKKKEEDKIVPIQGNSSQAIKDYSAMVYISYDDAISKAKLLQQSIETFGTNPNSSNFELCKQAWLAARIPYGQTEAYRLYGGPIDGEDGPEGYINGWPLDESFIDYVEGNTESGIINLPKLYPTINDSLLLTLNEKDSETNIATGFHAIEFLLWGQDLYANSAGKRPYTDYVMASNSSANRRLQYLKVCSSLLVTQLTEVRDAWKVGAAWYSNFNNPVNKNISLRMIFDGIGKLSKGELAGERMNVALENEDQEDEHSCFSDNTHIDIRMNFLGIKNVYLNTYISTNGIKTQGYSLSELVKAKSIETDKEILLALENCEKYINDIPAPFDQAIINEKEKVVKAIKELQKLSDAIAGGASKLGLQISAD
ncbi:MAG: hypothetical protein EAZ07_07330 [Cytophagales bacterium]|nr:MAG: hypothetical protein EAZ07_07330 [Cytophagales bacterium]